MVLGNDVEWPNRWSALVEKLPRFGEIRMLEQLASWAREDSDYSEFSCLPVGVVAGRLLEICVTFVTLCPYYHHSRCSD